MSKTKPFFFVLIGFLAALGVLSFSHIGPAQAQSPGVNLAQLVAQMNSLQSTVTSQGKTITHLQNLSNGQGAEITDLNSVIANQSSQITALKALTAPFSLSIDPDVGRKNTLLTITGINVQIVSGSGYTDDDTLGEAKGASLSGLGNLIIGYNATGNTYGDTRTGSHNLILGDQNSFSSCGGLVAGYDNTVSGLYASVSGGLQNTASGTVASIGGGYSNTASGSLATVSGGNTLTQDREFGWTGGNYHTP